MAKKPKEDMKAAALELCAREGGKKQLTFAQAKSALAHTGDMMVEKPWVLAAVLKNSLRREKRKKLR